MADAPTSPPRSRGLLDLSRDLRDASDSAILRVTQVIDTLPERGAADRLLDGLRPRLSALRPPRPPALSRVLFWPLQPVILAPGAWRPGTVGIPRSMITPITALVRTHLPDAGSVEAALAAGREPDDQLWQDAASILTTVPLPADWESVAFQVQTGIKPQALQPLLVVIRLAFAHARLLRQIGSEPEPAAEASRPLLLDAARSGPLSWSTMLTLLFEQTRAPGPLLRQVIELARASGFARQLEGGLQQVVDAVIDRLDQADAGSSPRAAPGSAAEAGPGRAQTDEALRTQARRAARLAGFCAMRAEMPAVGRLTQRRRQVAAECAAEFADGLRGATAACVPAGTLDPQAEQEAAERLEARLLALRELDLAARPLGEAQGREQLLSQAATFYAGADAPDWLTRADRLRLCEILVGAEAALRLADL